MKKVLSISAAITLPFLASAQSDYDYRAMEIFRICAMIFIVGLFMVFIIAIMKRIMDHRIRNKIVDKGIPENIASSILQSSPKEDGNVNIKWFSILAGIGAALTIIYYTQPLGIHSLAIMAFCLSASFLGYYFFTRSTEK
ncbi:hypothetical protein [Flavihumibacter profundi]|uniref:hypothetical protein n=1 Tax=Flavihumibacter profundi TaxID=2716883 RepID=UPI001CC7C473|nr:hypothetical protein [Flavihumibacter profundi]MBZ5856808.1 hypothetical protein [Flavihumibacter profundi]